MILHSRFFGKNIEVLFVDAIKRKDSAMAEDIFTYADNKKSLITLIKSISLLDALIELSSSFKFVGQQRSLLALAFR